MAATSPVAESRLEAVERRMYADLYRALPRALAGELGIEWADSVAGLRLTCSAADHPFFNRVMAAHGPVEAAELVELVEHYRGRGVGRWMLQTPPDAVDAGLEARCAELGLASLRGWAKHAGPAQRVPARSRRSDLVVERVGPDRVADWAAIVAPAFGFPSGSEEWLAATAGRPGWLHFVAYDGDRPAAGAALFVHDRIGTLGFAATLESYRRRGAQSALIAARLEAARAEGLEWVVAETDEELPDRPNPSYHNVERAGLPAVYVRPNWGPPPPAA